VSDSYLKGGGTFVQKIKMESGSYNSAGTWSIAESNIIEFTGLLVLWDEFKEKEMDPPMKMGAKGYVDESRGQIAFDDAGHCTLIKEGRNSK
jgi:hypothetical protein